MSKINNGGPAFPLHGGVEQLETSLPLQGMTLRDYFAAKALPVIYTQAMEEAAEGSGLFQHEDWRMGLALDAYLMADAMLRARGEA